MVGFDQSDRFAGSIARDRSGPGLKRNRIQTVGLGDLGRRQAGQHTSLVKLVQHRPYGPVASSIRHRKLPKESASLCCKLKDWDGRRGSPINTAELGHRPQFYNMRLGCRRPLWNCFVEAGQRSLQRAVISGGGISSLSNRWREVFPAKPEPVRVTHSNERSL